MEGGEQLEQAGLLVGDADVVVARPAGVEGVDRDQGPPGWGRDSPGNKKKIFFSMCAWGRLVWVWV